jgi:hypothetical protein
VNPPAALLLPAEHRSGKSKGHQRQDTARQQTSISTLTASRSATAFCALSVSTPLSFASSRLRARSSSALSTATLDVSSIIILGASVRGPGRRGAGVREGEGRGMGERGAQQLIGCTGGSSLSPRKKATLGHMARANSHGNEAKSCKCSDVLARTIPRRGYCGGKAMQVAATTNQQHPAQTQVAERSMPHSPGKKCS